MKKINRKGYMLVEIIVSFSITFVILISLTNLLIKYKNVNEDLLYSTKYINDKNLVTRNIMNDLEKLTVINAQKSEDNKTLTLVVEISDTEGNITFETRKLIIDGDTITYGKYDETLQKFDEDDYSYYTKKLEPSLIMNGIEIDTSTTNQYFSAKIKTSSMYSDENYDINIFAESKQTAINIIYKVNGGLRTDNNKANDITETTDTGATYQLKNNNIFYKTGYELNYWALDAEGSEQKYPSSTETSPSTIILNENTTFYAIWEPMNNFLVWENEIVSTTNGKNSAKELKNMDLSGFKTISFNVEIYNNSTKDPAGIISITTGKKTTKYEYLYSDIEKCIPTEEEETCIVTIEGMEIDKTLHNGLSSIKITGTTIKNTQVIFKNVKLNP